MIYVFITLILIAADQYTKYLAANNLMENSIDIFNWLKLTYVENSGAAFGMLAGKQTFFIILTAAVLVVFSAYVINHRFEFNTLEKIALTLFLSGAVGNFIDRLMNAYVIDFISVRLFNVYDFPVFNLADCYISVAAVLFIIIVILGDKK
ncbi:signal peptidase II [uncultured Ezakiella sp.]|uniref:signal peptidase II n=1 Tax=uncultured Ezakiella sp. TaxID=1637529 RepID=UPI0025D6742A|nr:signal peptidase II [uncultured Ezakiella sp.]